MSGPRAPANSNLSDEEKRALLVQRLQERARLGEFPLSSAQARLWFLHQLFPETSAYNVPHILELRGPLRVDILTRAFDRLVERHEVLRTRFTEKDGIPLQTVAPTAPSIVRFLDATDTAGEEVSAWLTAEATRPFDLRAEPLLRVVVVQQAHQRYLLMIVFHHLAGDLWSLDILNRELALLYAAGCRGAVADLPRATTSYLDFALWQQLAGHDASQLAYWRNQLGGLEPLQLRTDRPRPEVQNGQAGQLPVTIPAVTLERLEALGRRHKATLFMVLLTGLAVLLHRLTDQEDFAVGVPVAGRSRRELEDVVGFFVNTLAMRLRPGSRMTVAELLSQVRETALAGYVAGDIPFEKVIDELQPRRDLGRNPLVQVLLAVQTAPVRSLQLTDLEVMPVSMDLGTHARFDLEFILWPRHDGAGFGGVVQYDKNLFEHQTIERMWSGFLALLAELPADHQKIGDLAVLQAEERHQVLTQLAPGVSRPSTTKSVLAMLLAQAEAHPDRIAVEHAGEQISHAALHASARGLATRLAAAGVGPDVCVGILLHRSPQLILAMLAVLYAGGAYTLIDPSNLSGRTDRELAGCRVVVTHDSLSDAPRRMGIPWIDVDAQGQPDVQLGAPRVSPENLLYVVYTSGSTGAPRGVAMPQRVMVNLIEDQQRNLGDAARTLQFASLGFDVASQEILFTLASGGTLVLLSEEQRRDPELLLPLLRHARISRLFLPCTLLKELAASAVASDPHLPDLTQLISAGEQLVMTPAISAVLEANPQCCLINQYGPAETHVVSSYALPANDPAVTPPPIGRPIENSQLYVTSSRMQPVAVGSAGEIYIGGAAVSRGYAGLPAATAARFVPDPFARHPGARLYRTGDLGRWRSDGQLEFLGRADSQIKVQGYRVEPQEVEAVLSEHAAVQDCAVTAIGRESASRRLVAAVVVKAPVTEEALITFLRAQLPSYMIPSRIAMVDALPLTPTGKLHRSQVERLCQQAPLEASTLPVSLPADRGMQPPSHDLREPRPEGGNGPAAERLDALERDIAAGWAEVLGLATVPTRTSFFELGGTSLLVIRLQRQLRQALQLEVSVAAIFKHPSVRELALHLSRPAETQASPALNPALQRRSQLQKEAMRQRADQARGRR